MVKRICFEDPPADVQARLDSGEYRRTDGTIRDAASGELRFHLKECPCDEADDKDVSGDDIAFVVLDHVDSTRGGDEEVEKLELSTGAVLAGLALVGLTVGAVTAIASSSRSRKEDRQNLEWRIAEARRDAAQVAAIRVSAPAGWYDDGSGQLRWWDGRDWTQHYYTASPREAAPAGWYDDGSGELRWWDGQDWTQHYYTAAPQVAAPAGWYDDSSGRQRWWGGQEWTEQYQGLQPPDEKSALSGTSSSGLERGHDLPTISMSRAQWEEQVRVMLQARTISELQWRLLSNARIEDAESDIHQWQAWLRTVTAQEFSQYVDQYVASQPAQAFELATAGWYDDGSGRQRWWDGLEWTQYVQPAESRMLLPGQ